MSLLNQKTIKEPVNFSGVGLHNGENANITIKPSEPNSGIIFRPTRDKSIVSQLSTELSFRKKNILIRVGVQFPLYDMEYMQIPYFKLTYLID